MASLNTLVDRSFFNDNIEFAENCFVSGCKFIGCTLILNKDSNYTRSFAEFTHNVFINCTLEGDAWPWNSLDNMGDVSLFISRLQP
jgi:hypothetical protein